MDALPNANQDDCRSELTLSTIPAAKNENGVSVGYVPDPTKRWYIFRVSYGREDKAYDWLVDQKVFAYVPKQYAINKTTNKKVLVSMMSNFVFAYLTAQDAELYVKGTTTVKRDDKVETLITPIPRLTDILHYYYDHTTTLADGMNPPTTIRRDVMESFIRTTLLHDEHVKMARKDEVVFKTNTEVRVIAGRFQGVIGRVVRHKRQQCVAIQVTNQHLCLTAYIPSDFVRAIPSSSTTT
jgi:transcription antitermination factor NusG